MTPTNPATPAATGTAQGKSTAVKKPWYGAVPGLKIFLTPVATSPVLTGEEDAAGSDAAVSDVVVSSRRPVDVPPFERPGSVLRASSGAAARGWYAPRLAGAPSTTRQAEILNTGIIGAPTGIDGVVNGTDTLSSTMISHDAPTAYNATPRKLTSPNVLIIGTVGSGKSSFTKTVMVMRPLLLKNHRAVVFDKKDEGGEGEYAGVTRRMGTEPLRFDPDGSGTRFNLMDPLIAQGTGLQGQMLLINAVARIARGDTPATEWEEKATRYALQLLFEKFQDTRRAATTTDLMPFLGLVPTDQGLSGEASERFHQAGLSIRFGLQNLLETYAGVFDGETSRRVDLSHKLTTFDISQLPDSGPAIPTVMAIGNMWLMGRLREERGFVTNVIYEEGWHMIGGPSAQLVKSNQKLSRSLGISNVFVMHKGTDIPPDSPGYTVVQEAQTVYAFRQDRPEDARWAQETFNFAPDTAATLMGLNPGHCVFKYGSNPETHIRHIRSDWEVEVTNTDSAMAAGNATT
ncbi:ATP/GTP-binding protein [Cryobacterium sp. TMT1-21]|uniref:ATP/GTP-binding protein n=1 Tax=Cryobacterium sp. TMT1-21 TaxID=1259234 RepID=UPI00106C8432|nr:ATP/GTP-binding protein [Cryobacterium sp. TMT1-21]TFD11343.1 ATP/GTP-binding protein [Cryobacterium sp. TMT1-21]